MDHLYISVDIETAGPSPSRYSMLALGACVVDEPRRVFYAELQPITTDVVPEALAVSGLSMEELAAHGEPPDGAMARFTTWVDEVAAGRRPVFVALNAPFDWMFVADYMHRFAGHNPFGHSALDLKALFMGIAGVRWSHTALADMAKHYGLDIELPHHALEDAVAQAKVFRAMLLDLDVSAERDRPSTK